MTRLQIANIVVGATIALAGVGATAIALVAMGRWPVTDMGGVVARMFIFGLVLVQAVTTLIVILLTVGVRNHPVLGPRVWVFWIWVMVALVVITFGAAIGYDAIRR